MVEVTLLAHIRLPFPLHVRYPWPIDMRRSTLRLPSLFALLLSSCAAPPPTRAPVDVVVLASRPAQAAPEVEDSPRQPAPPSSARYILKSDVPNTPENAAVIAFCERYRTAVEEKNVDLLVSMAAPDYYEDGGNVDPADDVDAQALESYLRTSFGNAQEIRYEIHYRRIVRENDVILVDYFYTATYRFAGAQPKTLSDDNRMVLVLAGDGFLIQSGM
ncbi:nuclear transport factor 2 family protein [Polyangium jinanense]|uniref:Nuclear transport factor 2 family protein n=1 Tax=Polyangium jinanense TaxID=2829994 RepID=A0A9X4AX93_9BACT|nr:nuclear transport factor 2 family protein [Polyangium jinanense]MDC3988114.1 nuclear transport factor 2 family protein [Polyangium jinanense]